MNMIKERRLALGMTQPQLSALLREVDPRIDVGMISRFEQEVCFPTESVLEGLETALQAHRSELYPSLTLAVVPEEPAEMSGTTPTVAALVPFGAENAISRDKLAAALGVPDRLMRAAVSRARQDGIVIINDQTGRGYYRSDDVADLRRQLRQTHSRAVSLLAQERHLSARIRAAEAAEGGRI